MAKVSTNKLISVPETMLITLWARGVEQDRKNPILVDIDAKEALAKIDYDFTRFSASRMSQVGCSVRAKVLDDETKAFIQKHPDAVVVQLGAGLDARFSRLWRPDITHWYDLDLPEAIEVRKKLLSESDTNTFLSQSLFDYSWIDQALSHKKPVLIVVEGVFMYFEEEKVREFFAEICNRFEKTTIIFDMLSPIVKGKSKKHDAVKNISSDAEFHWTNLDTKEIEKWNPKIRVMHEVYLSDVTPKGRMPWLFELAVKIPYFYTRLNQRMVRVEIGK